MWIAKQLDLSADLWFRALRAAAGPPRPGVAAERALAPWRGAADATVLATLSVRSAFDLFLAACVEEWGWRPGDEIAFTAHTIADMPRIARERGFAVVGVDVDPATTRPDPEAVERALGPRTRALVATHLYGARLDLAPLAGVLERRGVRMVEDAAQAYAGPAWAGTPGATASFFSFGPIKTATALGGAVAVVRDRTLAAAMARIHGAWPVQPDAEYLRRVAKYGGILAVQGPRAYGAAVGLARALGIDHDRVVQALTRGFAGTGFFARIRRRPCPGLQEVMALRFAEGAGPARRRVSAGRHLAGALGPDIALPARGADPHYWWLAPVLAPAPARLVAGLRRAGFDATPGRSLAVVRSDRPAAGVPGAERLHRESVFVPFGPHMPDEELTRLAAAVRQLIHGADDPAGRPAEATR